MLGQRLDFKNLPASGFSHETLLHSGGKGIERDLFFDFDPSAIGIDQNVLAVAAYCHLGFVKSLSVFLFLRKALDRGSPALLAHCLLYRWRQVRALAFLFLRRTPHRA